MRDPDTLDIPDDARAAALAQVAYAVYLAHAAPAPSAPLAWERLGAHVRACWMAIATAVADAAASAEAPSAPARMAPGLATAAFHAYVAEANAARGPHHLAMAGDWDALAAHVQLGWLAAVHAVLRAVVPLLPPAPTESQTPDVPADPAPADVPAWMRGPHPHQHYWKSAGFDRERTGHLLLFCQTCGRLILVDAARHTVVALPLPEGVAPPDAGG